MTRDIVYYRKLKYYFDMKKRVLFFFYLWFQKQSSYEIESYYVCLFSRQFFFLCVPRNSRLSISKNAII
ncbi:hypothetical protein BD770DRAFT_383334 [Pilaira anomala]|nr:hypothetical protein BD770DRAFT_383334 [Pilaira anomala]